MIAAFLSFLVSAFRARCQSCKGKGEVLVHGRIQNDRGDGFPLTALVKCPRVQWQRGGTVSPYVRDLTAQLRWLLAHGEDARASRIADAILDQVLPQVAP